MIGTFSGDLEELVLNVSYINNHTHKLLELEIANKTGIIEYQTEMVSRNSIEGILPITTLRRNDNYIFRYDVTDLEPLSEGLKNMKFSKVNLISFLESLTSIIIKGEDFLLYKNCFVLSKDLVYIKKNLLNPYMVYVPIKMDTDISIMFKNFLEDLIHRSITLENENDDYFVQKILHYLKSEEYNIFQFYKYIRELRNERVNGDYQEENSIENLAKQELAIKNQFQPSLSEASVDSYQNELDKGISKDKVIKIMLAIISQILIATILVLSQDFINNLNQNVTTTYIGLTIMIIAIDVILLKVLFSNDNSLIK